MSAPLPLNPALNGPAPCIPLSETVWGLQEKMTSTNKTVVVTGGTGQLGRQVVKAFEKDGWNVVGTGPSYQD